MITRRRFLSGAAALIGASALAQRISGGSQLIPGSRDCRGIAGCKRELPAGRHA